MALLQKLDTNLIISLMILVTLSVLYSSQVNDTVLESSY